MRQPRRRHRSLKYCNDGKLEGGPGHVGEYCGKKQEERGPVRFLHPNFPRCQSKYKESAQPLKVWRDKPLPAFLSVLFRALGCFPSTAPKKKKRKRERETTPGRETPLQQTPSGSASEKQQRRRRLRDSDAEEGTFQTTPLPLPLVTSQRPGEVHITRAHTRWVSVQNYSESPRGPRSEDMKRSPRCQKDPDINRTVACHPSSASTSHHAAFRLPRLSNEGRSS